MNRAELAIFLKQYGDTNFYSSRYYPDKDGSIDLLNIKLNDDSSKQKVSSAFYNHLVKLLEFLKDRGNTAEELEVIHFAIRAYIKHTLGQDRHSCRNAFISFTRPRKQKRRNGEDGTGYQGRPNIFEDDRYRKIINRKRK